MTPGATAPAFTAGSGAHAPGTAWRVPPVAGGRVILRLTSAIVAIDLAAFASARWAPPGFAEEIALVGVVLTLVVAFALINAAWLPLRALEAAADRVARGDHAARVRLPHLVDADLRRGASAMNHLLDAVAAERGRARTLAARAIRVDDRERAAIGRELHEGTAQQLAALSLLLGGAERPAADVARDDAPAGEPRDARGDTQRRRMDVIRGIVRDALHEVRELSHTAHPRVLDELGLPAALDALAARTREGTAAEVRVSCDARVALAPASAATLYQVAQEAVRNAVRHAAPRSVRIALAVDAHEAVLTVEDDGRGFDPAVVECAADGVGLFAMRERVALVSGWMSVSSRPAHGTRIQAVVPITPPTASA
ncbi:ATP-binding protein [Roseisolibacter sp. H3M3-2]|uniref:sensor histidine kinase n=1 Tax=Roseisolibacter sp. H3M3-2 TaxID=3031323 RepID=UPI0023DAE2F5|nr:ATP-binding protein [Roseisolibacter sp. H3M3-2]MDF1504884.1 ATP-binding protein [Roseisolibacter sp. H3M3-2]